MTALPLSPRETLPFIHFSPEQTIEFQSLFLSALDGNFGSDFLPRLNQLGYLIVKKEWPLYLEEISGLPLALEENRSFFVEMCELIRAAAIPSSYLMELILCHCEAAPDLPLARALLETAQLAASDNFNHYHNFIHSNNVSFLAVAAANAEGLDPKSKLLLALTGQAHDLRHPGLSLKLPVRHQLEKKALAVFGIEHFEIAGEQIQSLEIHPGTPARLLEEGDLASIVKMILGTYSGEEDALKIKKDYSQKKEAKMPIPLELRRQAIAVEADLGESLSRVGNRLASEACFREIMQSSERENELLPGEKIDQLRARYLENPCAFIETWMPVTDAFEKMGLLDETKKLFDERRKEKKK